MKKLHIYLLTALTLIFSLLSYSVAFAAACTTPSPSYGVATMAQNVSTTGTYRIWARIQVPSTANNSILLEVNDNDGMNDAECYTLSTTQTNTWVWVSASPNPTLSAGSVDFRLLGNKPGVKVDRVIATADVNCTPNNTLQNGSVGNNCATPPDTFVPSVNITSPANGTTVSGSVNIVVDAVDDNGGSGISRVELLVGSSVVATDTTSPYSLSLNTTTLSNGNNTVTVRAVDRAGNTATDTLSVLVQNASADTQKPSTPSGLTATATAYNRVNFDWSDSTDNVGVTGYYVQRSTGSGSTSYVTIADVRTGSVYVDSSVAGGTTYNYRVAAFDAAGNLSSYPNPVSTTTPSLADTQAPSAPGNLNLSQPADPQINLTWTASTDNVGVKEYEVYRSVAGGTFSKIATTTSLAFGNTALSSNTAYSYYVIALDAAGNRSAQSATKTLTTPSFIVVLGGSNIVGRIADSKTNRPILGATATVTGNGIMQTYATENVKGFFITYPLPPGIYSVKLSAPNHVSRTITGVEVQKDKSTSVKNVKLESN